MSIEDKVRNLVGAWCPDLNQYAKQQFVAELLAARLEPSGGLVERITRTLYEADALLDRRAAGYHKALVRVVLDALSDSLAKESS